MKQSNLCLGLCFFANQLFYAVNKPDQTDRLAHIGSVNFNFNVPEAILHGESDPVNGIRQTISQLQGQYGIKQINILSFPSRECWTTLPKIVYDKPDEREAHINILMNGIDRKLVEATWHPLSNQNFRFLVLRNKPMLQGLRHITAGNASIELVSDFEMGERWVAHTGEKGSFMSIGCFGGCITVSSYILGKLRGATYLSYEDSKDLPYLWLQTAKQLSWMQGLHEEIYIYGQEAFRIVEVLDPFWDDAGTVIKMNTLEIMQVKAEEDTYSFNLEQAFPAILLAMESTTSADVA